MHKIYIASTLTNAARVRHLRDILKQHDIGLTFDWTERITEDAHSIPGIPDNQPELKRDIAEKELIGIYKAEVVLVVLPGGRGTHFEFGAAFMLQKPIVMLLDQHNSDNSPSFYYLDSLQKCWSEETAISCVLRFVNKEWAVTNHFVGGLLNRLMIGDL